MMLPYCTNCGERIHDPADADICGDSHSGGDGPTFLHADCPCPEHGWGGNRAGYANPDAPE